SRSGSTPRWRPQSCPRTAGSCSTSCAGTAPCRSGPTRPRSPGASSRRCWTAGRATRGRWRNTRRARASPIPPRDRPRLLLAVLRLVAGERADGARVDVARVVAAEDAVAGELVDGAVVERAAEEQHVVARQDIAAVVADQDVGTLLAAQDVVARSADEDVVCRV